ncbi:MAG: DNA-protecting protein DprA [Planctomycetaceae bacterium]|nr:DNA-protecting protein DprA [Planctomycetaceae bacterium]
MNDNLSDIQKAYLALNMVKGIGPRMQTLLLERFGSPDKILSASASELAEVRGVGNKIIDAIRDTNPLDIARREYEECQQKGISFISWEDEGYPISLKEIFDPPIVLYKKGTIEPVDQLAVAIVGSRKCTAYGRRITEKLSSGLARAGVTIISGLARGIDSIAHRAAMKAGGRTIAVCANGLAMTYPPEHHDLAEEISQQGAILSESPLNMQPTRGLFPQRNRIVSGLSLGVIVIEASTTSGTLHTARHAMEQGREIFAVPGQIDSRESEGCHRLIRDGAKLIQGVDDILEELGPLIEPVQPSQAKNTEVRVPRELSLSTQQSEILNLLGLEPISIDLLIERAGIEPSRILSTLTILEMKRLIERLPGNQILRIPR